MHAKMFQYHCVLITLFMLELVFLSKQDTQLKKSNYAGCNSVSSTMQNDTKILQHILLEPHFWEIFTYEVRNKKTWKCQFPPDILSQNLDADSKLYKDDKVFRHRRKHAESLKVNDSLWSIMVLGACKELAHGTPGVFVTELKKFNVFEAIKDYVDHLHYFYRIASIMEDRGVKVTVYGQNASTIHDIDKLDPVMVVGYSERFEDNKTTSLWDLCVNRHTHVNSHHQGHCLWHDCCQIQNEEKCLNTGDSAINEMVCDKVSRRLQKNFDGKENDQMWDADLSFYKGLPTTWLDKAVRIMHDLKNWKRAD